MAKKPLTVVGNLAQWNLPSLDRRISELIDSLHHQKLARASDREGLGAIVWTPLRNGMLDCGGTAANEIIAAWLQGHSDGRPELTIQLPFLETDDEVAPLTITYSVVALDGSRMILRTAEFGALLLEAVEAIDEGIERHAIRAKTIADKLRALADELELAVDQ